MMQHYDDGVTLYRGLIVGWGGGCSFESLENINVRILTVPLERRLETSWGSLMSKFLFFSF